MLSLKEIVNKKDTSYEVVVSTEFGGFTLTKEMCEEINLNYPQDDKFFKYDRSNPHLVQLVKKFNPAGLKIVELTLEQIFKGYLQDVSGKERVLFVENTDLEYLKDSCKPLTEYLSGNDA